jgi:dissimilatory sulfite reductase (desulfoviridin) alpha/beta subunit
MQVLAEFAENAKEFLPELCAPKLEKPGASVIELLCSEHAIEVRTNVVQIENSLCVLCA